MLEFILQGERSKFLPPNDSVVPSFLSYKEQRSSVWSDLSNLNGTNGFIVQETTPSDLYLGYGIAGGCDLNKDGIVDLALGSDGFVFVVFGKNQTAWTTPLNTSNIASPIGFTINGSTTGFGWSVDCVDGNLLTGDWTASSSAGQGYLLFGKTGAWSSSFNITTVAGTSECTVFSMPSGTQWKFGSVVAWIGDINADGLSDFVILANYNQDFAISAPLYLSNTGIVYVIFGSNSTTWPLSFNASDIGGSQLKGSQVNFLIAL